MVFYTSSYLMLIIKKRFQNIGETYLLIKKVVDLISYNIWFCDCPLTIHNIFTLNILLMYLNIEFKFIKSDTFYWWKNFPKISIFTAAIFVLSIYILKRVVQLYVCLI